MNFYFSLELISDNKEIEILLKGRKRKYHKKNKKEVIVVKESQSKCAETQCDSGINSSIN